jgi:hypothetical protein
MCRRGPGRNSACILPASAVAKRTTGNNQAYGRGPLWTSVAARPLGRTSRRCRLWVVAWLYPLHMVIALPALAPRPRPVPLRLVYTFLIVAALAGVPWLVSEASHRIDRVPSSLWPSPALVLLVLGALVAPRVSYRWFDAYLLLIPIVGLFYLGRFAWRLSLLPYRDWPPRPDEAPRWRKVAHPSRPGAGLYLVDRTSKADDQQ